MKAKSKLKDELLFSLAMTLWLGSMSIPFMILLFLGYDIGFTISSPWIAKIQEPTITNQALEALLNIFPWICGLIPSMLWVLFHNYMSKRLGILVCNLNQGGNND